MFDPDGPNVARNVIFKPLSDDEIKAYGTANLEKPVGYMDVELMNGEKVEVGIGLLAALGIQLSFPTLLEGAKRIKNMMENDAPRRP